MIKLNDFKVALGDAAKDLKKEEIIKLRENQDKMAEVFFDYWLSEINKNKIKLIPCQRNRIV